MSEQQQEKSAPNSQNTTEQGEAPKGLQPAHNERASKEEKELSKNNAELAFFANHEAITSEQALSKDDAELAFFSNHDAVPSHVAPPHTDEKPDEEENDA